MMLLVSNKLTSSMVMRTCFAVLILFQLVQCSVNDLDSAVALPSLTQAILERKNIQRLDREQTYQNAEHKTQSCRKRENDLEFCDVLSTP
ncbi:hypothetical protein M3Y98_01106500 [Aphelenchoides besseyi]|nr:hypothetical protein M3Y98_01106500 [Aphelenchoides besseyi]